jgi:L-fuculose-phosphate aldolase
MNARQVAGDMIDACQQLADRGYLAGTSGNIACRIDSEHFAITPSGCDYYSLCVRDICVLRLSDLAQVAGDLVPSVERKLHAAVLRARPDCMASIHTHQPIASAYTLLGCDLDIIMPEYMAVLGTRALSVGYAPSGTGWLAARLGRKLRSEVHAYFLRNHGVVCCGGSLSETVVRVDVLEEACAHFFRNVIASSKTRSADAWSSEVAALFLHSRNREGSR